VCIATTKITTAKTTTTQQVLMCTWSNTVYIL